MLKYWEGPREGAEPQHQEFRGNTACPPIQSMLSTKQLSEKVRKEKMVYIIVMMMIIVHLFHNHTSNRKRELLRGKKFSANISSMMAVKHTLQKQFCFYKTGFQLILYQSVRICTKPTFSLLRIIFSSCFLLHLRLCSSVPILMLRRL